MRLCRIFKRETEARASSRFLIFLLALSFLTFPLTASQKEASSAYLMIARKLGCICDLKEGLEELSEIQIDPFSERLHKLLDEKGDLTLHVKPLISKEALHDYLRIYRQEEERILREGKRGDRLRFVSLLQSRIEGFSAEQRTEKIFYLIRCASALSKREYGTLSKVFHRIQELLEPDRLPEIVAFTEACKRYLSLGKIDPVSYTHLTLPTKA